MIYGQRLSVGGHFRSGFTFARALTRLGHSVSAVFPCALPGLADEWIQAGIHVSLAYPERTEVPSGFIGRRTQILSRMRVILQRHRDSPIDIFHCQDENALREGLWAAALLHKGVLCTRAGGEARTSQVPSNMEFVLYSQELKDQHLRLPGRFHPEHLHVIPARFEIPLDASPILTDNAEATDGLRASRVNIFMAMRLKPDKTKWLDTLERILVSAAAQKLPIWITLAGDGPLRERTTRLAESLEHEHSSARLLHLGFVKEETRLWSFIRASDGIMGHGRGLIEGMMMGKPALVLGEQGEMELVTPDNIERIAYYNFSGRHFRAAPPPRDADGLADLKRLVDVEERYRIGAWSAGYMRERMPVGVGAADLLKVYHSAARKPATIMQALRWEIWHRVVRRKPGA